MNEKIFTIQYTRLEFCDTSIIVSNHSVEDT